MSSPSDLSPARAGRPPRRLVVAFLSGVVILTAGIACAVSAGIGVATWDTLMVAVSNLTGLSVGLSNTALGLLIALLAIPLGVRPNWATAVIVLVGGPLIDLWLLLIPEPVNLAASLALLAAACVGIAVGLALYLTSDVGFGPHDSLAGAFIRRGIPMRTVKIITDVSTTALGWALGGPVGAGTVVLMLVPGWLLGLLEPTARALLFPEVPTETQAAAALT